MSVVLLCLLLGGEVQDEAPPFTEAQQRWLEEHMKPPPAPAPASRIEWRAETYFKGLYTNDQSQGSLWLGSPHPQGDNYSGANGIGYELVLYLKSQVSERVEAGARIASRWGVQFADFYENGDRSAS